MSHSAILQKLQGHVGELLHFSPAEVDVEVPLLEMGADSLIIVEIIRRVQHDFGVQLTVRQLFEEFVTVAALSSYVAERSAGAANGTSEGAAPGRSAPVRGVRHEPAGNVEDIARNLTTHLATLLHFQPHEVEQHVPLLEMGADSLVIVEVIRRVEQDHGVRLTVRQLFEEFVTVEALSEHIAGRVNEAPFGVAGPSSPAHVTPKDGVHQQADSPQMARGGVHQPTNGHTGDDTQVERLRQLIEQAQGLIALSSKGRAPAHVNGQAGWGAAPAIAETSRAAQRSIELYRSRTAKSQAAHVGERRLRPELGVTGAGEGGVLQIPLVFTHAAGSRLVDLDGNEYIDLFMGGGCHLFGHRPAFLLRALSAQLSTGMQLGPVNEHTGAVAEKIGRLMSAERVTFANTYTEALMTALRLCRTATGRSRVVTFAGAAPARLDPLLPGTRGVPARLTDDTRVVHGLREAIEMMSTEPDVAAIVVDPARLEPSDGAALRELRHLAARRGACFIVDERETLFRLAPGGANQAYGLDADVAVHAGALSDGLAASVLAGRASVLDHVDGGWGGTPGGVSRGVPTTYTAGTYCRNPLSMAAARAVLDEVSRLGEGLGEQLCRRTAELAAELDATFERRSLPMSAKASGARFEIASTSASFDLGWLLLGLRNRGLYLDGGSCHISTAHSDADLNAIVDVVEASAEDSLREQMTRRAPATPAAVGSAYAR